MSVRRAVIVVLVFAMCLFPAVIWAQFPPPPSQQCGLVPSNPCKPGTVLTPSILGSISRLPETGPYTLIDTVSNYGGVGASYDVTCQPSSTQLPCSVTPGTFHLAIGQQQVVTMTYSTLGIGTFTYSIAVEGLADEGTGIAYVADATQTYKSGPVTVSGPSIVQHVFPGDGLEAFSYDTFVATYYHSSGINLATTKLLIDGKDSTAKVIASAAGYRAGLHSTSDYHSWASFVCANSGRCDSLTTTFSTVGGGSFTLDDSLPPAGNPLNLNSSLLGPLALPTDTNLWGCARQTGYPEISFNQPTSFLNQSTPNGRVFVAVIDTAHPTMSIQTQTLAWLPNHSKTCSQLSYLDKTLFDYSMFPALPPTDPHWASYPWLSMNTPRENPWDFLGEEATELAFGPSLHGPRAPGPGPWRAEWRPPVLLARRLPNHEDGSGASGRQFSDGPRALMLPSPGPIDSLSWHVELNDSVIIDHSVAVNNSGVTGIVQGKLFQTAQIPISNPNYHVSTNGGWNQLVASIKDTAGHMTSIRVRFVHDAAGAAGAPAALAIQSQRNFAHLDQGDCAAFGAFQCDGVTLAYGVPGFVTRDKERGVHLVYRSASQKAKLTIPLQLSITKVQKAPDSLYVVPVRNGVVDSTLITRYAGAMGAVTGPNASNIFEDRDEVRIVASEVDSAPGEANIRKVRHGVRSWFKTGVSPSFRDDTLSQDVVQLYLSTQASTRFGQGWQLAEIGRLVFNSPSGALQFQGATAAIWLDGDGSYTVFRKPASTWVSPPGETTRMVQLGSPLNGATYVLYLENGASLGFRSDGWQVWTNDLIGNATRYMYATTSSNQLDSIVDPTKKAIAFTYFNTGKRNGYVRSIQVRTDSVRTDTITVTTLDYDTVSNTNAVRLAKIRMIRSATQADSTRFTYRTGAAGAFVDSIIDPRHTVGAPVVSRVAWDSLMWTPQSLSRPLGGLSQVRQIWRRASPRIGYGRWRTSPTDHPPLERTVQAVQYVGTYVPFAGPTIDYQVDGFGGPTYVLNGTGQSAGILGTNSADVRHIVRDTIGRALRVVHNRYAPTDADSLIYHYDALGRVDTLRRTTRQYWTAGQTRTMDTLTFVYDSVTIAAGAAWCSRLTSSKDAFGIATRVVYLTTAGTDKCLPQLVIGTATDTTKFTYSNGNHPVAGNPAGVRPISVKDPNGVRDSVAYQTATWNSEYLFEPQISATSRAFYNVFGRPDSIIDPEGKPSQFVYDLSGRVTHSRIGTGSLAPASRNTYDPGGLATETAVYVPTGEDITFLPSNASKTLRYFDPLGRLDSLINPGGRGISPTGYKARKQSWAIRDGFGNPRWDFTGNGSFVSRLYDALGHVTQEDESQVVSYQSVDGERFADAATTTWWNSMLMPVGRALSAGATHKYTYDAKGQLATTASRDMFLPDTSYVNHTYAYSRSGQLVLETTHFTGGDVRRRYEYNRRGQRSSAVDSTSAYGTLISGEGVGRIDYWYDSTTARLDSIVGKVAGTPYGKVSYTYDRGGREFTRVVRAGAAPGVPLTTTTSYDAVGRVAGITTGSHYIFGSAVYNKVGDLQSYSSTEPGVTSGSHQYTYATDGTRRLLASVEGGLSYAYTYDFQGNRLTEWADQTVGTSTVCENTITATYDADNRLVRRIPGAMLANCMKTRYWTDQAGNRLGESDTTASNPTNPPLNGLQSAMSYTAAGQLYFSINLAGDLFHNSYDWHWYDASGRRAMSQISDRNLSVLYPHPDSVGGYRTYYIYDGDDVALQLVRSGSTWSVDQRFMTGGLDRQLVGRFSLAGVYKNETLIADRNGSLVRALDASGAIENNAAYFPRNAFGALAAITGTGGVPLGGVGYAGAGTPNARGGFVYMRNRWYDPQTGRFLTQDPIGMAGGVNLYAYAGNNPIAYSDPYGLLSCCPTATAGAVEAVAGSDAAAGGAILAIPLINDELQDEKTYLTYSRTNAQTGQVYYGRTSGTGAPAALADARAEGHPEYLAGFGAPVVDKVASGKGAYEAIRGREQQLIDAHGGIGSPEVANKIRAVRKLNPAGPLYHNESNKRFGEIAPYSGSMGFMFKLLP